MDRDALQVLRTEYQLNVIESKLLRERGSRKVWYIRTTKGSFCFKKYDKEIYRYHFSFELQNALMRRNSNIPRLIPTLNALLYALDQRGRVYVLFEWIHGVTPVDLRQSLDLKRSLTALARFHRDAFTFSPSSSSLQRNRRYRFTTTKEKRELETLKSWNESILGQKGMQYHRLTLENAYAVLENMDALIQNGDLEAEAQKGYIAHNDFADSNLLATKDKTYIIDLDTASYNYPTVDIMSIYIKTCSKEKIPLYILPLWFRYYESVFSLSPILKRYLIYQLQLPTIYRRSLNKQLITDGELSGYLELFNWEREKNRVLQSLL